MSTAATEALAGIDTEQSRAFVAQRATELDTRGLVTRTEDPSIASGYPAWQREIYAAEMERRGWPVPTWDVTAADFARFDERRKAVQE